MNESGAPASPAAPAPPVATQDAAPAPEGPRRRTPFAHTGRVRELLAISLVNLLLKVVTLGLYHFWAKTRVRRYVWSHTQYAGEAFEYTGRGPELLLGYLVAMAVLVPLVLGVEYVPTLVEGVPLLAVAAGLAVYPLLAFLTGYARYASRRYLLSRTRWRSIRFGLTGRARRHGVLLLVGALLTVISFGLFLPFVRNRLVAHMVNTARFGTERFTYDGRDDVLLRRFLLTGALMAGLVALWVALVAVALPLVMRLLRVPEVPDGLAVLPGILGLVALGLLFPLLALAWLWYRAGELRHWVGHTRLGGARFALELPTRRYLWLYVSNLAALLLSVGLAYPWVVVRTTRTLTGALRMEGPLDVEAIAQAVAEAPATGEGLADALDLGSI